MATRAGRATPVHLWIVGLLALLWNAFGCYDYLMTETGNAAYLANYAPDQLAYFNSLPGWLVAPWALGVWGGLIGAVLLLMRSRYAVWAFAVSLIGIVTMTLNSMTNPYPASMVSTGGTVFEWTIKLVAVLLLWYAWTMRKRGVLR